MVRNPCGGSQWPIVGEVHAAIVALTHSLNARVARELLGEGISVLVEKPMAVSAAEAREVLSASEARGPRVGYTRRFGYGTEFARRAIGEDLLGTITRFSVEDGYPFKLELRGAGVSFKKRQWRRLTYGYWLPTFLTCSSTGSDH
jgi:predicted dehydrogenase